MKPSLPQRQRVKRFWLQPTATFPEGAPQRESYMTDAAFERASAKYDSEWRATYQCAGCDDRWCPQCGTKDPSL